MAYADQNRNIPDAGGPQELSGAGSSPGNGVALGGGASPENVTELQRHLQFVEEEAELLRRSLIEMEEQNKLLMNEINRYKSDLPPPVSVLSSNSLSSLADGLLGDSSSRDGASREEPYVHTFQDGAVLISTDAPAQDEELRVAKLQIGELSGKVKKLQYENRVLLSNLQRCDLASFHAPSSTLRLALETDAEAGDSADCLPTRCLFFSRSANGRLATLISHSFPKTTLVRFCACTAQPSAKRRWGERTTARRSKNGESSLRMTPRRPSTSAWSARSPTYCWP